jgi:hypothetical protein
MPKMFTKARWSSSLCNVLFLGLLVLQISCSRGDRRPLSRVKGKVLFEGRPAENAVVFFHPRDKSEKDRPTPQGRVDADGAFQLTTYDANDGAPPGQYVVTVVWAEYGKRSDDITKLLVPPRYMSPATSGLSAEVGDRSTELPPFHLKK